MSKRPMHGPGMVAAARVAGALLPVAQHAPDDALPTSGDGAAPILIVEDDYLVASELEAALSDAGFHVIGIARSAGEAAQLARAEKPRLAIVDIRLDGDDDGVDVAQALLREGIRTIFATAHSDPQIRERAKPSRPVAWVAKPYNPARLVPMIRNFFAASSGEAPTS